MPRSGACIGASVCFADTLLEREKTLELLELVAELPSGHSHQKLTASSLAACATTDVKQKAQQSSGRGRWRRYLNRGIALVLNDRSAATPTDEPWSEVEAEAPTSRHERLQPRLRH
jgi:hypothetical protein